MCLGTRNGRMFHGPLYARVQERARQGHLPYQIRGSVSTCCVHPADMLAHWDRTGRGCSRLSSSSASHVAPKLAVDLDSQGIVQTKRAAGASRHAAMQSFIPDSSLVHFQEQQRAPRNLVIGTNQWSKPKGARIGQIGIIVGFRW